LYIPFYVYILRYLQVELKCALKSIIHSSIQMTDCSINHCIKLYAWASSTNYITKEVTKLIRKISMVYINNIVHGYVTKIVAKFVVMRGGRYLNCYQIFKVWPMALVKRHKQLVTNVYRKNSELWVNNRSLMIIARPFPNDIFK
jgi:hypothetical protein